MRATLLTADLSFNRSAIMTAAWAEARAEQAKLAGWGIVPSVRKCLAAGLRLAWLTAKVEREYAQAEARRARMSGAQLRIADLEDARFCARHIDSTREMLRTVAAIDAQLSILRIAA